MNICELQLLDGISQWNGCPTGPREIIDCLQPSSGNIAATATCTRPAPAVACEPGGTVWDGVGHKCLGKSCTCKREHRFYCLVTSPGPALKFQAQARPIPAGQSPPRPGPGPQYVGPKARPAQGTSVHARTHARTHEHVFGYLGVTSVFDGTKQRTSQWLEWKFHGVSRQKAELSSPNMKISVLTLVAIIVAILANYSSAKKTVACSSTAAVNQAARCSTMTLTNAFGRRQLVPAYTGSTNLS
ncbi:hypothetical protein LSAT2_027589, partial [Lamellibrachia satsuma]